MTAALPNAVLTAFTDAADEHRAATELADQLLHANLGFVLFFCSMEYDLERLAQAMQERFGDLPLSGCTSCGEITARGYDRGTIVAIGFDRRFFSVGHRLVERLDQFSLQDAQQLCDSLMVECGDQVTGAPSDSNTFVLTLMDGLSVNEELVLATLNSALGGITSFGGSAGDEYRLISTYVYSQGRFHSDAASVIMVCTLLDFEVFSFHHLMPETTKLVVTAADPERRTVHELNAEPAAEAYARLIGLRVEELDDVAFARHPLAVRINDRYYARAVQRVNGDLSLSFYCAVENGIVLTAMRTDSILDNLRAHLSEIESRIGEPWVTIGCDCCMRQLELAADRRLEQASTILRRYGVRGFSTYGEQINGMHINHTLTGVVIGRKNRAR